jgi:quercetin 2,3-dioxygenase
MTAGSGIIHSEMPEQRDGLMRGFQLWLNLPAKDKMQPARYRDVAANEIPTIVLAAGVTAKLLAGELVGRSGVVETGATAPLYIDIHAVPGSRCAIALPATHTGFIYPYEGEVSVGEAESATRLETTELGVLSQGGLVTLAAGDVGARLLLAAAKPLDEPIVKHGPFVMNTQAEIHQAIADFRNGRF